MTKETAMTVYKQHTKKNAWTNHRLLQLIFHDDFQVESSNL